MRKIAMPRRLPRGLPRGPIFSLLIGLLAAAPAAAAPPAAEPDTQTMIEALMPSATRSLRNLVVRQKPGTAAEASTASAAAASATVSATVSAAVGPAVSTAVGTAPGAADPAVASPAAASAGPPPSLALAIQFETNSARVRPESGLVLGSLVAAMQSPELKTSRFLIEGHADASGAVEANQRLSQERAEEVRLYLVALGVHPARLRAVGRGATRLANTADPLAAANRRVRVVTVE